MDREYGHLTKEIEQRKSCRKLNIMTMGDSAVGKSCLVKRYCEGKFIKEYISTIGIDYGLKTILLDGTEVKINFYDCAGDSIYSEIRNEFYKDIHGILLVFDITDKLTFQKLDRWIADIKQSCKNAQIILVGNKRDMGTSTIQKKELSQFRSENNAEYYESSACDGNNVEILFNALFSKCLII